MKMELFTNRKKIDSIFTEKMTFDGFDFRTTRINEAVELLCLISKRLAVKKMGLT